MMSAASELEAAGVASPRVDAEELAAFLLQTPRSRLGLHPLVDEEWGVQYRALIDRRKSRVPLQHLLGTAVLGPTTVQVGPGVFIPRPETESLLEWALLAIADIERPVVVDLCTGSGALALAIAQARPDATVHAVEKADGALAWARRNAELHAAAGHTPILLRGADATDDRAVYDLDSKADLVTVNPPYVPDGTTVEPEVRDHDPRDAVFAGPDGLDVIRPLISITAGMLKLGGVVGMEHDDTQGESVPALFRARRVFTDVEDHLDLAGRPRFVTARRVSISD